MKHLDAAKLGWVSRLPAAAPAKDALAGIVDADGGRDEADGGRDEAENSYYEAVSDPRFVRIETAQRRFRGRYLPRLRRLTERVRSNEL
jgi:hypothetical protein